MLFNSINYIVFLIVIFVIYWAVLHKYRMPLIFCGSYIFYMCWDAKYIILIICITLVSYIAAYIIDVNSSVMVRKIALTINCILCSGILIIFKYLNFSISIIGDILSLVGIHISLHTFSIALPVGISFFTFQTMSYVIDTYRKNISAEHNLLAYATFVSFFPQLVAGPIERSSNLLSQLKSEKKFDYNMAIEGCRLILWGLLKKVAIADIAAKYVDLVYGNLKSYTGIDLVLAVFLFTIQIYCDFSGYTDIARGSANLLGISLVENFKSPYLSKSIKEYWRRWHISLSTWFRDYIYIPLGGNKCSKIRNDMNLLVTFLVSGLWHGANWTFLMWGGNSWNGTDL